jgi:hypothetical protein
MFVQAAATIRQVIDRRHTDYGDARGYYAKVPQIAAPLRKAWKPYLDGTISRSEAIRRIVDATRDLNPTSRPRASMGRPRHRPEPGRCAPRPFFP